MQTYNTAKSPNAAYVSPKKPRGLIAGAQKKKPKPKQPRKR